jgi:hypothetical protein
MAVIDAAVALHDMYHPMPSHDGSSRCQSSRRMMYMTCQLHGAWWLLPPMQLPCWFLRVFCGLVFLLAHTM